MGQISSCHMGMGQVGRIQLISTIYTVQHMVTCSLSHTAVCYELQTVNMYNCHIDEQIIQIKLKLCVVNSPPVPSYIKVIITLSYHSSNMETN